MQPRSQHVLQPALLVVDSAAQMTRLLLPILLGTALFAGACSSDEAVDAPSIVSTLSVTTTTPTTDSSPTSEPTAPRGDAVPVRTLDDHIAWVLDALNGASATEADVEERFSAAFLGATSPWAVVASIGQLQATSASWTVSEVDGHATGAQVRLTAESGPWIMLIGTSVDGSIEFLSVQPDTLHVDEPPSSFGELVELLMTVGEVAMLAADVSGNTCEPIHAFEASSPRPIGSDFKLYVLGALVEAIVAGDLGWDNTLPIRDHLKSLPSGTFQDLEDGTERTVREFAEAMIAISDNTATDHLIDLLGRDRIEAAQARYGHADPSLNEPFLTTRELFVLKLALGEDDRDAYIATGVDERLTILETEVAATKVTIGDAAAWITPIAISDLEWFASPADLCHAMIQLHASRAEPDRAAIRAILGANPGLYDHEPWSYVGFKGGSEVGVLSLAWYLEGDSGRYVYVVNVTNTAKRLPELQLVDLAQMGINFLVAE